MGWVLGCIRQHGHFGFLFGDLCGRGTFPILRAVLRSSSGALSVEWHTRDDAADLWWCVGLSYLREGDRLG
eukprot:6630684-Prorocentrum_lima.AAC.1